MPQELVSYDTPEFARFEAAYRDGRVRDTHWYWGLTDHQWHELVSQTTHALDVAPTPTHYLDEGTVRLGYPEVVHTGGLLASLFPGRVYWNPRTGAWVTATVAGAGPGPGTGLPPCVAQMRIDLQRLDELRRDGTLQEDEWRGQRLRVIADCLGGGARS